MSDISQARRRADALAGVVGGPLMLMMLGDDDHGQSGFGAVGAGGNGLPTLDAEGYYVATSSVAVFGDAFTNSLIEAFWQVIGGVWDEFADGLACFDADGHPVLFGALGTQQTWPRGVELSVSGPFFTGTAGLWYGEFNGSNEFSGYRLDATGGTWTLRRYAADALAATVATGITGGWDPSDVIGLRILAGGTCEVLKNAGVIATGTDNVVTTGRVGLWCLNPETFLSFTAQKL